MNRIYISDHGDDKNDGRTRETAIYSWKRAIKLCDGNAEAHLMQGDATLQRLAQEIERLRARDSLGGKNTLDIDCGLVRQE
jgi:hypothetical protein